MIPRRPPPARAVAGPSGVMTIASRAANRSTNERRGRLSTGRRHFERRPRSITRVVPLVAGALRLPNCRRCQTAVRPSVRPSGRLVAPIGCGRGANRHRSAKVTQVGSAWAEMEPHATMSGPAKVCPPSGRAHPQRAPPTGQIEPSANAANCRPSSAPPLSKQVSPARRRRRCRRRRRAGRGNRSNLGHSFIFNHLACSGRKR